MAEQRCPECGGRLSSNYCDICMRKVPFAGAKSRRHQDPWEYSSAHREEADHKCITFDTQPVERPKQTFTDTKRTFQKPKAKPAPRKKSTAGAVVAAILAIVSLLTAASGLIESAMESVTPEYSVETLPDDFLVSAEVPAIEPEVLYDDGEIVICADSAGLYYEDYAVSFTIENNSEKDIEVNLRALSINGYMFDFGFFAEVPQGETSQTLLSLYSYELNDAGITQIGDISFVLDIYDYYDYTCIATTDRLTLETELAGSFEQPVDDSGLELYQDGSVRLVLQRVEFYDYGDCMLSFYIENLSDSPCAVSTQDVFVNEGPIHNMLWQELQPGTRGLESMYLLEDDLEDLNINGADEIYNITLDLYVEYLDGYDVVESHSASVSFDPWAIS